MNYLEPHLFQYSDIQGSRSFREEIAKFLTGCARAAKALNPEHITVMNGCCDAFATVLCQLYYASLVVHLIFQHLGQDHFVHLDFVNFMCLDFIASFCINSKCKEITKISQMKSLFLENH